MFHTGPGRGDLELDANNCFNRSLKKVDPEHQLLVDLEEKSALFDKAATKYSPKVSA
jgi:hypothetical protein